MTSDIVAGPSRALTLLLAASTGIVVANIYYAQPLVALIGPEIGLDPRAASLVVTLTQLGYVAGLLLLVPLGDLAENRRLMVLTIGTGAVALGVTAATRSGAVFLLSSFAIGVTASSVQMVVPFAAGLAPPAERGRVVGNVMSGLLLGILLARPAASFAAHHLGWRTMFVVASALQVGLAALLWRALPRRDPGPSASYGTLLASLWPVLRDNPALQRRAFYQAFIFGTFTLFWTAVPLHLAGPAFRLDQDGIALFALSGAVGALCAPLTGRLADRGYGTALTFGAFACAALSFAGAGLAAGSLAGLVLAAVVLDAATQMHQITAQRVIYALPATIRSRVTALYIAGMFVGGAIGSALASPVYAAAGWPGVAAVGTGFGLVPLLTFAWHRWRERRSISADLSS